jgi:hypothetical protein
MKKPLENIQEKCRSGGVPQGTIPRPLRRFHGSASGVPKIMKFVRWTGGAPRQGIAKRLLSKPYDRTIGLSASGEKCPTWNCFTYCFAFVSKTFRRNCESISQKKIKHLRFVNPK